MGILKTVFGQTFVLSQAKTSAIAKKPFNDTHQMR